MAAHGAAGDSGAGRALDALTEELARKKSALDAAARTRNSLEATADTITGLLTQLNRSGFAVEKELWPQRLTAEHLPALTEALARIEKPLEEQYFAARQASADLAKEQEALRAELNAVSGGKWVYPHGDAATKVRDAVNAELKSRGMTADAKIFCELLTVADESWQDCVEACLGDRRFDILVPPAHYAAAKSAFVALGDRVGPISLLDTPGIRKADRHAETAPADSLAAQVTSENPLAAQYADTILRRIVCCDTPDTLEHFPDSATRDLLRHHPFRLERLRRPQRYFGLGGFAAAVGLSGKLCFQRVGTLPAGIQTDIAPGPAAPPSLPAGTPAQAPALYRSGCPQGACRCAGSTACRPGRPLPRSRPDRKDPEICLRPVPERPAGPCAGTAGRTLGQPGRAGCRPCRLRRAGAEAGGLP